jgi:hypothetical protein
VPSDSALFLGIGFGACAALAESSTLVSSDSSFCSMTLARSIVREVERS